MHGNLPGLLVVEDEKNTRDGLRLALEDKFEIYLASDATSAWNILETEQIDVMLTDLRLGVDSGLDLIGKTKTLPKPPVCIMMTAYGSVDGAVEAMKKGAYDFVTKPFNLEKLELLLLRALRSRQIEAENKELKHQLHHKYGVEKIMGNSPLIQAILDKVHQVANSRASVMIEGESGTGKELVAQAIHQLSSRRERPMVIVHCAALSPQLLESELFGHEKGAFTGASERRVGRFEEAHHGTIFLDEIGEIDASIQVKLLRVLGERTIQRVGSNQTISVDVRVIAATNRNLDQMVRDGKFREDLFFRLEVVKLTLPALRERKEDLPILIQSFIREFAREDNKSVTGLTADAQAAMFKYDWPGNVRELRMAIQHGVVLARGSLIALSDLPERIFSPILSLNGQSSSPSENNLNLEEVERAYIMRALQLSGGNRTEAAQKLGISRRTLHRKIKIYQLEGGNQN